ncbi:type 1 glutamine amidotransferase [Blastopirellula marina]|uniref:Aminotransferase n=1 Tax=Blastopirellula marina TaxID=124 RepID=A0A2S8F7T9_9BACT|nr:type 1 glutamine amidotransferase [Blastopirellula marina]PQO28229.1 aminotransferase [Blastopirellula marina]PTL41769.1 type 1 glutamine amidotransferase [Blastopirellula marina]
MSDYRVLLIQIRDADDPIGQQEIGCFAAALDCPESAIRVFDLLTTELTASHLADCDMIVIGGSGRYSVTSDAPWMSKAIKSLQFLLESGKPTFASCWGFQALSRAAGGKVIHDLDNAELGTHSVFLTEAGKQDPIFSQLPESFLAYMGHEDRVSVLPPGTTLLATNSRVAQQAYRFDDRPVYCTQFHPELTLPALHARIEAYPEYCERIAKIPFDVFCQQCQPATDSESILRRFTKQYLR